ncbi:histidine phosphatase family protein [Clostridium sp.]
MVRHGMDNDNYRGGWSDLGLIEEGIEQAKLLAKYLRHLLLEFTKLSI